MPNFITRVFSFWRLARARRRAENTYSGAPTSLRPGEVVFGDAEEKLYVCKPDGSVAVFSSDFHNVPPPPPPRPVIENLDYAPVIQPDATEADIFCVTLQGDATLEGPLNGYDGQVVRFYLAQDSEGERAVTLGAAFLTPGSLPDPLPFSVEPLVLDALVAAYDAVLSRWLVLTFEQGYSSVLVPPEEPYVPPEPGEDSSSSASSESLGSLVSSESTSSDVPEEISFLAIPARPAVAGRLFATGSNYYGIYGNGTTTSSLFATAVGAPGDIDDDWVFSSVSNQHALAIKSDGTLWSWGRNNAGQMGNGVRNMLVTTTSQQVGIYADWVTAQTDGATCLAIDENGDLYMWGNNQSGALGNGRITTWPELGAEQLIPTRVTLPGPVAQAVTNGQCTYAVLIDGTVYRWGSENGALRKTPTLVTIAPGRIKWVTLATTSGGAINEYGELYLWGRNNFGQLARGTRDPVGQWVWNAPQQVGSRTDWAQVRCYVDNTFAATEDGALYAAGSNSIWNGDLLNITGMLGDNTTTNRWSFVEVLASGGCVDAHSGLALTSAGQRLVWGVNAVSGLSSTAGVFGNGALLSANRPTLVSSPGVVLSVSLAAQSASHFLVDAETL